MVGVILEGNAYPIYMVASYNDDETLSLVM